MHYAPQILLCCMAWISIFTSCMAKEPVDPELLKKVTKDVESVLSPTLVEELQGAQSNRSAINAEQTVPRNPEPPRGINDKKPDIQFDNQVYPYHYERSYHYQYPPNPQDDPSRPVGYTEHFYEPRFRPKGHVTDGRDTNYYRSELYKPFGTSSNHNSQINSNVQASSGANANAAVNGDVKQTDNPGTSEPFNGPTPLPPSSFAHSDILSSPPQPHPFPSYRHGVFGRPPLNSNYFRPNGDAAQYQNDPPVGHYLPQGDGRFAEGLGPLPPHDSFQHYPGKTFQGYNEHRPVLPDSPVHRSQQLASPFLGSFFPPGYQSPFYGGYRPSENFNGLFGDNFTGNFPPRPSFGGFYPRHNYLPPPPSPSPSPSPTPTPAENKLEDFLPPGGPSSQPIPTTNPEDPAPLAAASNSLYHVKLFFPARDDVDHMTQPGRSRGLTYVSENLRF